jgi:WD40 repeat protein
MLAVTRLKTMELFEIKTGKLRHQIPKELEWSFQQFAPNNKKMAFCVIGGDGVIVWLDPFTGKLLDSWEGHKKAHMLRISQDGRTAVSGGSDGTVHVWDIGTGKTLRAPDKTARAFHFLAYAPDDKTVLAACSDFHFLDATTLAEQARIELDVSGSWTTAISPDGKTVAFRKYQDKKIVIVDTKSRKVLRSLESAASGTMTFGPDSNTLYHQCLAGKAGKEKNESQRTIRVWNTATGLELTPLYEGSVSESFPDMSISSQGKLIVAAATPGEKTILRIWDLATGKEEDQLDIEAKSVMFSHEGDILAASNDFGVIKFIDLKKRTKILEIRRPEKEDTFWCFTADDKTLALGHANGSFTLWSIPAGKKLAEIPAHRGPVTALAFSHDGETLVTGSSDGTILKWPAKAWRGK